MNRLGDRLLNTKERLKEMTGIAKDSEDMTNLINTTLQSDREKMLNIQRGVRKKCNELRIFSKRE